MNLNNVKRFKDFDQKYKPLFGSSGYSILFDAGKFSFSEKKGEKFFKKISAEDVLKMKEADDEFSCYDHIGAVHLEKRIVRKNPELDMISF